MGAFGRRYKYNNIKYDTKYVYHIVGYGIRSSTISIFILFLIMVFLLIGCESDIVQNNITKLKSKDPKVQIDAIVFLEKTKDIRVVVPLINCLKDKNNSVRESAKSALVSLGTLSTDPLIASLTDDNTEFISYVNNILLQIKDPNLMDILISSLNNQDFRIRKNSAHLLGKLKNNRSIYPLLEASKEVNLEVRKEALNSLLDIKFDLGWKNDKRVVNKLISSLNDKDAKVRELTLMCLYEIKEHQVVEGLLKALKDSDPGVQEKAIMGLMFIRDPKHIDIIFDLAKNEFGKVQKMALSYLGSINPKNDIFSKAILSDNNLKKISNNYKLFIICGAGGTEEVLIYAMERFGNITMAEDFLNCGNNKLKQAAEKYADKHGYLTIPMFEKSNSINWGR